MTFRRAKTHVIGSKDFTFGEILKVVNEEISSRVVRLASPSVLARRRLGRRRGGKALVARSLCAAGWRRSGERSVHCRTDRCDDGSACAISGFSGGIGGSVGELGESRRAERFEEPPCPLPAAGAGSLWRLSELVTTFPSGSGCMKNKKFLR